MKAAYFETFEGPLTVKEVPAPDPPEAGVVLRVLATGICRSDWHGWMGHDSDINLPHVPGHEMAGVVEAVGEGVALWKPGDRVTLPFVCACGSCPECLSGNHQVCDHQSQPGFKQWGSFAEYAAIHHADVNLVRLPEEMSFVTAASLGCRFVTSFRAIVNQGRLSGGQWVAVHGCGGVGLSAIMIADALGAQTVGIDIGADKLAFAESMGATATVDAHQVDDVAAAVKEITGGGAHISLDALGNPTVCFNSISCLRKRGKHVQVGLLSTEHSTPAIPMVQVVAHELEILGSHGIQAHCYEPLLAMIQSGKLHPEKLIGKTVTLEEGAQELAAMDEFRGQGITVIDRF